MNVVMGKNGGHNPIGLNDRFIIEWRKYRAHLLVLHRDFTKIDNEVLSGFLKLLLFRKLLCVFVCVSTPKAINNNYSLEMKLYQPIKQMERSSCDFILHLPSIL